MQASWFFRFIDRHSLGMLKYYRELRKSQWLSYDELRQLQLSKLKGLCRHFGMKVNSWDDFYELPFTTKSVLRDYIPTARSFAKTQTSGSTGEPFLFGVPLENRAINVATELRNWEWLGWNGERAIRLTRGEPSLKWRFYNSLIDITCRNYRTVGKSYLNLLRRYPYILHGGTSAIRELTWLAQREGLDPAETRCVCIGEDPTDHIPTLSKFYKEVYQSYGLSECVNVAFECQYHNLHVNMENCIVEEFDDELVVTNLNNYVTPFIRYKTGDKGHVRQTNCKCELAFDVITDLHGKGVDFYGGDEVKRPLGWWVASPLGHSYSHCFKRYKVDAYPQLKLMHVYVVPKASEKEAVDRLKPYCDWLESQTGLQAHVIAVDEIPECHKLFEVHVD